MEKDEKIPFYQVYGYDVEEFDHIQIEGAMFSTRLYNRLKRIGIVTVADLLKLTCKDLKCISGFGKGCFDEIFKYLDSFTRQQITSEVKRYKQNIIEKDFSFVQDTQLNEESKRLIEIYREGYELIDLDLINACINGEQQVKQIISIMLNYTRAIEKNKKIKDKLYHRLNKKVLHFIRAFSRQESIRNELELIVDDNNMTLDGYITKISFNIEFKRKNIERFLLWCEFRIEEEISIFFNELFKDKRIYTIIKLRAEHNTLAQVGRELGITRERVRQIEAKCVKKFQTWQKSCRTLFKIYAERNEDKVLSTEELVDYFGSYYTEAVYLMQISTLDDVTYDRKLDMFIVDDESLIDKVLAYIEELPDNFEEEEAIEKIETANRERNLPCRIVERAIKENFNKTGPIYHRERLTLTSMYENILLKYYPQGIHVYDDKEVNHFRM